MVDVDAWWKQVDLVIVETAEVAGQRKVPPVDVSQVAPWIPLLNRSSVVINSESKVKRKNLKGSICLISTALPM